MADGNQSPEDRAGFRAMTEGTQEDYQKIFAAAMSFNAGLAGRIIDHLKLLDGDYGGFPVDRLTHCLQTATRAHRDGRDEEYVVCALLHDIGDTLGGYNHQDVAAAILKPFISEKNHWMIANHGIFQGYYFFHHVGLDRNMRDQFKDHPYYQDTEEFCHKYDQMAFDPDYESEPLEFFIPMVERVFAAPKNSMYMAEDNA